MADDIKKELGIEDEAPEGPESKITLEFLSTEIEGIEDYDQDEDIEIEFILKVTGKELIEKLPEEMNGQKIVDLTVKPVYKITTEITHSNITNKKKARRQAEEMGLSLDEVNEIKSRSARKDAL